MILAAVWMPGLAPRLYDDARYVELGLLAFVIPQLCRLAIADALTGAWLSMSVSFRFLVLLFLAGGTVAAVVSPAVNLGLLEIALTAQLIILVGVVACAVREGRVQAEMVLTVSVFAGAALCALKFWVIYILYAFEGKAFPWVSPFLEFANVRFFSQYQAYALFLAVIPMFIPNIGKGWRLLFFFVAANFWALHWMVGTRAAWLGLFVAVVVVPAFLRKGKLTWLRWHATAILAGAIIYLVFSHFVQVLPDIAPVPGVNSIVERGQGSIDERIALARTALQLVREHPLLGVGPGQFGLQPYPMNAAHPHNVPLQLLAEYGLIAGTAGIWLGALLFIFVIRTLREQPSGATDAIGPSLIAALLMGMTDSLFSGNLIMPQSQVLFCVIAGWIAGRSLPVGTTVYSGAVAFRTHRFAIVSTGLGAVAITTILALEYLPLARDLPAWLPRWNPHFWQYGRFYNW
ncbi:MAG: O-antigen ligase family protein [Betaproteobacteria bacterium]|nr:O-antigen ligase family protein [Betaproteobacteria bacterium]